MGIVFLIIFCAVLFISYIVVRRALLSAKTVGILCGALSMASLFGFGIAQDLLVLHALLLGIIVGLIFTVAIIIMAVFFQANQPKDLEPYLARKDEKPKRT